MPLTEGLEELELEKRIQAASIMWSQKKSDTQPLSVMPHIHFCIYVYRKQGAPSYHQQGQESISALNKGVE